MIKLPDFSVEALTTLTASDLAYGLKAGFITSYQSVKLSELAVNAGNPDEVIMDFACMKADDMSGELDRATAALTEGQDQLADSLVSLRKWVYWEISSLVEKGLEDSELFLAVEAVYADNGYPDFMKHLIYYVPAPDPRISSTPYLRDTILKFLENEGSNLFRIGPEIF